MQAFPLEALSSGELESRGIRLFSQRAEWRGFWAPTPLVPVPKMESSMVFQLKTVDQLSEREPA